MATEPGWAIRRWGSCLTTNYEVDCGTTGKLGFHACCPNVLQCQNPYNRVCCPLGGENCTESLVAAPKCANSTWDMFDNGGAFCCEHGQNAFNYNNSNICGDLGIPLTDVTRLPLISAGSPHDSSSTAASSAFSASSSAGFSAAEPESSPTGSNLATPDPSESQGSSTPVGAIVGGVVGGVGGLALIGLIAWFLIRRKRKDPYGATPENSHNVTYEAMDSARPPVQELNSEQTFHEAGGGKTRYAHVGEMPTTETPVELHGDSSTTK